MKEIYLVRHGQASFGAANYDALSPLGKQQSLWLGEYLRQRDIGFDAVFRGALVRHRETAEGILAGLGRALPQFEHAGLNEYNFTALHDIVAVHQPELRRPTLADKQTFYKELKRALMRWAAGEFVGQMPETWREFQQRVHDALRAALAHAGERILIVSSGGPLGVTIAQSLQAPDTTAVEMSLQVRNTCLCHYLAARSGLRLFSFNTVPHLDQPGRFDAITFA